MDRTLNTRIRKYSNLKTKSSSLYFLNDISNIGNECVLPDWRESYTINQVALGRGHFSKVFKAKCCSNGNIVAIKVIRRRRRGADKIDDIMKEVEIMQTLQKSSHVCFIQLINYHVTSVDVALVMEFAAGGSLYNVVLDSKVGLTDAYSKIVIAKIMSALSLLHINDIVHLDIKADNILLRFPYPSTDVAICDFGVAKRLSKCHVHREIVGTPDYIAPEVANYERITQKSDIWSMGVLTYFILTNLSPFLGSTKEETLTLVTKGQFEFRGQLQDESLGVTKDFIKNLLVKNPEHRLSAKEALSHEYLSSVSLLELHPSGNTFLDFSPVSFEEKPQIRNTQNYVRRAMITSQYEIDSSYSKSLLINGGSSAELLELNSGKNMEAAKSLADVTNPNGGINYSPKNDMSFKSDLNLFVPNNKQELHDQSIHNGEEFVEDSMNDDLTRNSPLNNSQISDNDIPKREEEVGVIEISMENSNLSNEEVEQSADSSIGKAENSSVTNPLDLPSNTDNTDMTMSTSTLPDFDDSTSNQIANNSEIMFESPFSDENMKENTRPLDVVTENAPVRQFDHHPTIYDSRRKIKRIESAFIQKSSALSVDSFRSSRDTLIEINAKTSNIIEKPTTQSCDAPDIPSFTDHPNKTESVIKRRNLSRSTRRDFDKPINLQNRHSQIILGSTYQSETDNNNCNNSNKGISKSHSTLDVLRIDTKKSFKKFNLFKRKQKDDDPNKSNSNKGIHCVIS